MEVRRILYFILCIQFQIILAENSSQITSLHRINSIYTDFVLIVKETASECVSFSKYVSTAVDDLLEIVFVQIDEFIIEANNSNFIDKECGLNLEKDLINAIKVIQNDFDMLETDFMLLLNKHADVFLITTDTIKSVYSLGADFEDEEEVGRAIEKKLGSVYEEIIEELLEGIKEIKAELVDVYNNVLNYLIDIEDKLEDCYL